MTGWKTPLSNRPDLYIHLRDIIDAVELLISRPSGAAGHVTLEDIVTYYEKVSDYEGSVKQFIHLFNLAESLIRNTKKSKPKR